MLRYVAVFSLGMLVGRGFRASKGGSPVAMTPPMPELPTELPLQPEPTPPASMPREREFTTIAANMMEMADHKLDLSFNLRELKTVVIAAAIAPVGREYAAEPAEITSLKAVITIADRASDALDLAYAKAWASSIAKPTDDELANKATSILDTKAALGKAFWELYAREIAEQAIRDLDVSTAELEAKAKEMPNATATVNDINKIGTAANKVGTAVKKAKDGSKPPASTTDTA